MRGPLKTGKACTYLLYLRAKHDFEERKYCYTDY